MEKCETPQGNGSKKSVDGKNIEMDSNGLLCMVGRWDCFEVFRLMSERNHLLIFINQRQNSTS
tara:strand:- start:782 stop:970 length:189 start_codon:yes stop_codon:yes gene_type:complete